MSTRRRSSRWRVPSSFGLAVLLHVALFFLAATTELGRGCVPPEGGDLAGAFRPAPPQAAPIDITMIDPRPLSPFASRPTPAQQQELQEQKVEEARQPEEDKDARGQVVDTAKPPVEIRPDDAKFLAEHDQKVEKETRGPSGRDAAGAARPTPPQPATPPRPAVAPTPPRPGVDGRAGALAMRKSDEGRGKEQGPDEGEKKEGGKEDGLESKAEAGDELARGQGAKPSDGGGDRGGVRPVPGAPGSPGAPPSLQQLRPSEEMLARAVGAGSMDYLKDVDEGADTLLNTKRWRYASFFNRVKRQVAQNWHPDQAYRLRDPTGQIYGLKNRLTVLKVSLHPDGRIRDILVEKPCGVEFLDDEAISAFQQAQPFPNPPDGLVDKGSNLITFRFGFYFEVSGRPKFRVFR